MDEEKRKKNAFTKPVRLSPELAALTGKESMGRPEVTSFFWAYVKEKGLKVRWGQLLEAASSCWAVAGAAHVVLRPAGRARAVMHRVLHCCATEFPCLLNADSPSLCCVLCDRLPSTGSRERPVHYL